MTAGYRALREGAGILDLSRRGRIRVSGEDRVRLLHAMTTNHIQQLAPGQGCWALFLNAQGRIMADVHVLVQPDFILLDTEPETREKIYAHLDKYIIADDVTLEDVTAGMGTLGLEGPKSAEVLAAVAGMMTDAYVSRITATGAEGHRIFLPADKVPSFLERLYQAGAVSASEDDMRTVRLEHGHPRYGEDISERDIPQEAQVLDAVHFNKGCYLGQEIVERVRSRGQVHRLLVPLRIETKEPPPQASELTADSQKAGETTSAAFSPALELVVALGYVREVYARPGTRLYCGDAPATVAERGQS
jgi:aminomethyltransferase